MISPFNPLYISCFSFGCLIGWKLGMPPIYLPVWGSLQRTSSLLLKSNSPIFQKTVSSVPLNLIGLLPFISFLKRNQVSEDSVKILEPLILWLFPTSILYLYFTVYQENCMVHPSLVKWIFWGPITKSLYIQMALKKTAVITPFGLFEFLISLSYLFVYMDNLLTVFSLLQKRNKLSIFVRSSISSWSFITLVRWQVSVLPEYLRLPWS